MSFPVLPQEIIHQILSNIPTKPLCTLLPTSKAVFLDVKGILHGRLENQLITKADHKLLFEAYLPLDQRTTPYYISSYTHTAPESPAFTASLYSYFSLSGDRQEVGSLRDLAALPASNRAEYTFTLGPEDYCPQLALVGNLVKMSPNKPGYMKAIVPCFGVRNYVRMRKEWLNDLAASGESGMIWVNEQREVGVWTRVVDRTVVDYEEEVGFRREHRMVGGAPMYSIQVEGSVKYTFVFEYLTMRTGYLLAKLEEMDRVDRNTLALIWKGPNQGEL